MLVLVVQHMLQLGETLGEHLHIMVSMGIQHHILQTQHFPALETECLVIDGCEGALCRRVMIGQPYHLLEDTIQ